MTDQAGISSLPPAIPSAIVNRRQDDEHVLDYWYLLNRRGALADPCSLTGMIHGPCVVRIRRDTHGDAIMTERYPADCQIPQV